MYSINAQSCNIFDLITYILAIHSILNNSFKAKYCFMEIILLTADKYNVIYTTQKKIRAVFCKTNLIKVYYTYLGKTGIRHITHSYVSLASWQYVKILKSIHWFTIKKYQPNIFL